MKKFISIVGCVFLCLSGALASTQAFVIKGANYMPIDVGAKYIYSKKLVSMGDNPIYKKSGSQTITVNSCDNKTMCNYLYEYKNNEGQLTGSENATEINKNGSIYVFYGADDRTILDNSTMIFPAQIAMDKVYKYKFKTGGVTTLGSYKVVKQMNDLTVEKNDFHNCVEFESKSVSALKNLGQIDGKYTETYCSGIGLVKGLYINLDDVSYEYTLESIEK